MVAAGATSPIGLNNTFAPLVFYERPKKIDALFIRAKLPV
jgi:hypothetical protein